MSDRLTEIRARLDAATPGPWHKHDDEPWVTNSATPPMRIIATGLRGQRENADLIAHAPADIAWLLDELQMAYADVDEAIRKGEDAADYYKQQFEALRKETGRE